MSGLIQKLTDGGAAGSLMPMSARDFALVALLAAAPASADVKAGVDAYQRGDHATAVREWRPLADRGDPDAQFNLAQAYKLGRGVPASLDGAMLLYRKAAAQKHPEAEALLGLLLFQNGKRGEAMPWLGKAANRGDAASQYVYDTALFNGDMVKQDRPRAYGLMIRAASQGLPPAQAALLVMDKHIPLAQRRQGVGLALLVNAPVRNASTRPMPTGNPSAVQASPPPRSPGPPPRAAGPVVAGWRVQLGAFAQPSNANALFGSLQTRVAALRGVRPILARAGTVTRLQAGPFASRAAAASACAAVKAWSGGACFPVVPMTST